MHELLNLNELIHLRQTLHRHPEVSGQEVQTAKLIANYLRQLAPDQLLENLGGNGVAAVFNGTSPSVGPTLLFRAELDALPIAETNTNLSYVSEVAGCGHKCGHDGHMAILAGLASLVHLKKPATGKVIVLFQPAEETGAGAYAVLQNSRFTAMQPDYVFGLHNLPGWPLHQAVVRQGVFAAASTGMEVKLWGKSSHAAEPENGLNPGEAMAEIILAFNKLAKQKELFKNLALLTLVHARLGEVAFGTNPGFATVMATLRAYEQNDLALLKSKAEAIVAETASKYKVRYEISYQEEFPATHSTPEAVQAVAQAATSLELDVAFAPSPFRWSEDFGHFTNMYKGAFFGLGAGTSQPQLHHADYDFPDDLLATGAQLFYAITSHYLNS